MDDTPETPLPRRILLAIALALSSMAYGMVALSFGLFPAGIYAHIQASFKEVFEDSIALAVRLPDPGIDVEIRDVEKLAPGLVLVAGVNVNRENFARVIDRKGIVVHEWTLNWFEFWDKNEGNFVAGRRPKRLLGAAIDGSVILPDGDLVFNFEGLSTIRLSPCGDVVWKLDNNGHHSVHVAEDGSLWVGSERFVPAGTPSGYQNHFGDMSSWSLQHLSPAGEILETIEVLDILEKNNLRGLMHLSTLHPDFTAVTFDTMHLNDIEIFPNGMDSNLFEPGDLLVSLRNINTIIVIDPTTKAIKFQSTGTVLRQHDPDFLPGDRILVYDNNNLDPSTGPLAPTSRIAVIDAKTGKTSTYFEGQGDAHFFSSILGRQQLLDNGNLMILSAKQARAFEVGPDGTLLWQYFNRHGNGYAGVLTEAHLLPQFMDREFFKRLGAECSSQ